MRLFKAILLLGLLLLILACENEGGEAVSVDGQSTEIPDSLVKANGAPRWGDLDVMRERRVIRALVTVSRTDFFLNHGRIHGIQAEFLRQFEQRLNQGVGDETKKLRVRYLPVPFDQLIAALEAGYGDIAAAFLTVTPEREARVRFATGRRLKPKEILVTHKDAWVPQSLDELAGRQVTVLRASSYAEHLREFSRRLQARGQAPIEVVEADSSLLSDDLLELVNAGILPMTVVDQYRARFWAKAFPDLRVHEELVLAESNEVGWAVRKDSPKLAEAIDRFIKDYGKGSLIGNMLFRRYFEDDKWISNPSGSAAMDRLQRYLPLFRKYARQYGFDALELAAQAYQESGLHQERTSHRGAVGIMQLLPSTAADKNVGIQNIDKVENNIHAGARYLAFLRDRYFSDPDISDQDRLLLSWAAYNAGPAKVREMRQLTRKMGLDPNRWFRNVELAAGRIVGRETVSYVSNIYKFKLAYQLARERKRERDQAKAQALQAF